MLRVSSRKPSACTTRRRRRWTPATWEPTRSGSTSSPRSSTLSRSCPGSSPAMDVLVIGAGGREHALAWRLRRDDGVRSVRIAPGNGGTPAVAETVPDLDVGDVTAVARHAARERYDLVVIGPEGPLAGGLADELSAARVPTFGPTRA